jgi:hypothetical protein
LYANLNSAEFDETTAITSFDSDGWTMGSYNGINNSGESFIFLAFKENPSTTVVPAGEMAFLLVAGGGGGGYRLRRWWGSWRFKNFFWLYIRRWCICGN